MNSTTPDISLVDFHCHLDLYADHEQQIRRCEALRTKILAVTNAPSVWPRNREMVSGCKHIRVALGLHPELAAKRGHEMALFEQLLKQSRYVGEVGLDGSPQLADTFAIQREVFGRILGLCAHEGGKVLTVHSRRAAKDVIALIGAELPADRGRVVLHWFTGSAGEAAQAVKLGCYFSVNSVMLTTGRGRQLVAGLPPERVLTETDGPFVSFQGHPAIPGDVLAVVQGLADVWGVHETAAATRVHDNLRRLLET